MSRSVLLQLARDSIAEVLEAQRTIDKAALPQEHPLLNEVVSTKVTLYLNNELRGSSQTLTPQNTLLEDIILNAKKSAFQDKNFQPITTSEYLHCEIEVSLTTAEGVISEKDEPIIKHNEIGLESVITSDKKS